MSQRRCAQLAAWGSAWLQGTATYDEVLDAIELSLPTDELRPRLDVPQRVRHVAGVGFEPGTPHPVGAALTEWKLAGTKVLRLALPVPGDVRGLVGPAEFRGAALDAGEAVFGAGFGVTAVLGPETPSSAGRECRWQRGPAAETPPDPISLADAEHDLTEAIRETASELARRGTTSWLSDVAPQLSDARRVGERLHLPASHPPRGVRLIAQAERLSAVFAVVDADQTGELTASAMADRRDSLGTLRVAVRRALLAGYNAAAEVESQRR